MIEIDISNKKIQDRLTKYKGTIIELLTTKISSRNTSGYKGVSKLKNGSYKAYINIQGKRINIGKFDTLQDAVKSRKTYEEVYYGKILKEFKEEKVMQNLQGFNEIILNTNKAKTYANEIGLRIQKGWRIIIYNISNELKEKTFKVFFSEDGSKLALVFTDENTTERKLKPRKNKNFCYINSKKLCETLTKNNWNLDDFYKGEFMKNNQNIIVFSK